MTWFTACLLLVVGFVFGWQFHQKRQLHKCEWRIDQNDVVPSQLTGTPVNDVFSANVVRDQCCQFGVAKMCEKEAFSLHFQRLLRQK